MVRFSVVVSKEAESMTYSVLTDYAEEQRITMGAVIDKQTAVLDAFARTLAPERESLASAKDLSAKLDMMRIYYSSFGGMGFAGPDGIARLNNGHTADVSGARFFKNSMRYCRTVDCIGDDLARAAGLTAAADRSYVVSVPVYQDGRVVGVLFGLYQASQLKRAAASNSIIGESYSFITDSNGEVLLPSSNPNYLLGRQRRSLLDLDTENFIAMLSTGSLQDGTSLSSVKEDFRLKRSGTLSYTIGPYSHYAVYIPMRVNDWMLICVIPIENVETRVSVISNSVFVTVFVVTICSLLLILYIYWLNRRKNREIGAERERLRQSEELYRIVGDLSDSVIFEADVESGVMSYNKTFKDKFGYEPRIKNFGDIARMVRADVAREDRHAVIELLRCVGSPCGERQIEYRTFSPDSKRHEWRRVEFAQVMDADGKVRRIVGRITNIDDEKRRMERLKEMAESDSLTGLLNRMAFEKRSSEWLSSDEKHGITALLIIDVDDFKQINDTQGHLKGDSALVAVAEAMRRCLNSADLTGRLGGDEFIALLKGLPSAETACAKAAALCKEASLLASDEETEVHVSIGVAVFENGESFEELYREADAALYDAKNGGKNGWRIRGAEGNQRS